MQRVRMRRDAGKYFARGISAMVKRRNMGKETRASGFFPGLTASEGIAANALLTGKDVGEAFRDAGMGKAAAARVLASERVRRAVAGAVAPSAAGVRGFVLERLVTEAEEAREGAARLKALELLGNLPGVAMWQPRDDRAASVREAGAALASVLQALADRMRAEPVSVTAVDVTDTVQSEPNVEDVQAHGGETGISEDTSEGKL